MIDFEIIELDNSDFLFSGPQYFAKNI